MTAFAMNGPVVVPAVLTVAACIVVARTVTAAFHDELGPWQLDAACRGEPPDAFFPDDPDHVGMAVRLLCSICDVREECLDHGLAHEAYGIWGGMSQAQLHRLRSIRRTTPDRPEMDRGGPTISE